MDSAEAELGRARKALSGARERLRRYHGELARCEQRRAVEMMDYARQGLGTAHRPSSIDIQRIAEARLDVKAAELDFELAHRDEYEARRDLEFARRRAGSAVER